MADCSVNDVDERGLTALEQYSHGRLVYLFLLGQSLHSVCLCLLHELLCLPTCLAASYSGLKQNYKITIFYNKCN